MTDLPTAPEVERGRGVSSMFEFTGVLPWGQWVDDVEKAPDLAWPTNVQTYDQMYRADAQCKGLYLGATAAIQRYAWYIDPNDCPMRWVKKLAADLNLPIGQDEARQSIQVGKKRARLRTRKRFSWYNHLAMALKAMYYGHYFFEQVGQLGDDGPGGRPIWHLRKLGPRHPRTITEILVNRDGGLVGVKQGYDLNDPTIPVDQLVAYVWDQEPGDWTGISMYRSMYRNYLIKDRLLRVDALKHERNGVGIPIISAPEGASWAQIQQLDQMAQEYKVGERAGGALPYGAKLTLQGTLGALPDTIASMRFQNEEMSRSMLMMFFQLGQTETGSRALGSSFIDWFSVQQEMIADWICDVTNEHVIEDWWDWNVDPDSDQVPLIGYIRGEDSQPQEQDFGPGTAPAGLFDNTDRVPQPPRESQPNNTDEPASGVSAGVGDRTGAIPHPSGEAAKINGGGVDNPPGVDVADLADLVPGSAATASPTTSNGRKP